MRVIRCDRCGAIYSDAKKEKAKLKEMIFCTKTDVFIHDLCEQCYNGLLEYLKAPNK
jgi:hypothetical protein